MATEEKHKFPKGFESAGKKRSFRAFFSKLSRSYLENLRNSQCFLKRNLMESIVKEEGMNHLILKLFSLDDGFALYIKADKERYICNGNYENLNFLEQIADGKMPLDWMNVLEEFTEYFLYDRYFLIEIRDCVGNYDFTDEKAVPFASFFGLLEITAEALIKKIRSEIRCFESEDLKLTLRQKEASLLVKHSEPLCLDPSPVSLKALFEEKKRVFDTPKLNKIFEKNWQSISKPPNNSLFQASSEFLNFLESEELNESDDDEFEIFVPNFKRNCLLVETNNSEHFRKLLKKRILTKRDSSDLPYIAETLTIQYDTINDVKTNVLCVYRVLDSRFHVEIVFPRNEKRNIIEIGDRWDLDKFICDHISKLTYGFRCRFRLFQARLNNPEICLFNSFTPVNDAENFYNSKPEHKRDFPSESDTESSHDDKSMDISSRITVIENRRDAEMCSNGVSEYEMDSEIIKLKNLNLSSEIDVEIAKKPEMVARTTFKDILLDDTTVKGNERHAETISKRSKTRLQQCDIETIRQIFLAKFPDKTFGIKRRKTE